MKGMRSTWFRYHSFSFTTSVLPLGTKRWTWRITSPACTSTQRNVWHQQTHSLFTKNTLIRGDGHAVFLVSLRQTPDNRPWHWNWTKSENHKPSCLNRHHRTFNVIIPQNHSALPLVCDTNCAPKLSLYICIAMYRTQMVIGSPYVNRIWTTKWFSIALITFVSVERDSEQ